MTGGVNFNKWLTDYDEYVFGQVVSKLSDQEVNIAPLKNPNNRWRVISGLQKVIRRGQEDLALLYATKLWSHDATYVSRRMAIIGLEDLSLGDITTCTEVMSLASKVSRSRKHGNTRVIQYMAWTMANAVKSRVACDIACFGGALPYSTLGVDSEGNYDASKLVDIACDPECGLDSRYLALVVLGGGGVLGTTKTNRVYVEKNVSALVEALNTLKTSYDLQYLMLKSSVTGLEGVRLAAGTIIANEVYVENEGDPHSDIRGFDNLLSGNPLHGVPYCAYDTHTTEGKKAYSYLLKSVPVLSQWINDHCIPEKMVMPFLGSAVFNVEGVLADKLTYDPIARAIDGLNVEANTLRFKITPEQLYEFYRLLEDNIDGLNKAREKVTGHVA